MNSGVELLYDSLLMSIRIYTWRWLFEEINNNSNTFNFVHKSEGKFNTIHDLWPQLPIFDLGGKNGIFNGLLLVDHFRYFTKPFQHFSQIFCSATMYNCYSCWCTDWILQLNCLKFFHEDRVPPYIKTIKTKSSTNLLINHRRALQLFKKNNLCIKYTNFINSIFYIFYWKP